MKCVYPSANCFPATPEENGIEISSFVFRLLLAWITELELPFSFPSSLDIEKRNSNSYFRFWFSRNFGKRNSNFHFRYSSFVFLPH